MISRASQNRGYDAFTASSGYQAHRNKTQRAQRNLNVLPTNPFCVLWQVFFYSYWTFPRKRKLDFTAWIHLHVSWQKKIFNVALIVTYSELYYDWNVTWSHWVLPRWQQSFWFKFFLSIPVFFLLLMQFSWKVWATCRTAECENPRGELASCLIRRLSSFLPSWVLYLA